MAHPDNKIFVFILGSHRSGTSALARFMSSLGVWLGPDLIQAKPGINDEGFWEHKEIVAINDRILAHFGSAWHDIRPLPANWWESSVLSALKNEALQLISRDFEGRKLVGAKDPRFCRLLPFWAPLVRELGWSPVAINGYRSIISASESLQKRDGFPRVLCQLIWLVNNVEMELNTRGIKTAFVEYDYFLDGPGKMANNLKSYFPEVPFVMPDSPEMGINKSLRHHFVRGDALALDLAPLELLGEEVADNFRSARSPEIKERMDHIRSSVMAISSASPLLSELAMGLSEGYIRANRKMIELGDMHSHAQGVVQQRDAQIHLLNISSSSAQKEKERLEVENSRLGTEVHTLREKLREAVNINTPEKLEVAKNKSSNISAQEKKLADLQATLEKRNSELRSTLAKIRDMQTEINNCNDKIESLVEEVHSKESLLAASESIIKGQASLIDAKTADLQESAESCSALKQDIERLSNRLHDSIKRNMAIQDKLSEKDKKLISLDSECKNYRELLKGLEADKRFYKEKELYFDRMLLQISSELEDAKKVSGEREVYLESLQSDIGGLNKRISELHYELSERDRALAEAQEKFFYLRVRFLSRLLIKIGLYKVPHE